MAELDNNLETVIEEEQQPDSTEKGDKKNS